MSLGYAKGAQAEAAEAFCANFVEECFGFSSPLEKDRRAWSVQGVFHDDTIGRRLFRT